MLFLRLESHHEDIVRILRWREVWSDDEVWEFGWVVAIVLPRSHNGGDLGWGLARTMLLIPSPVVH